MVTKKQVRPVITGASRLAKLTNEAALRGLTINALAKLIIEDWADRR